MRPFPARQLPLSLALRLGAGLAGVTALTGCQVVDLGANNVAQVRFIQASQDAPGIDFYANSTVEAYNVGFGYGTSYVPVVPGSYTVTADQAGSKTVLATASQGMATAHQYTAILSGSLATLQETILTDQSSPAPGGEIAVRVINEATHAGTVDVYLVPSSGKLANTALISSLAGLQVGANAGYVNIPAGTYSIVVVPTGTVPTSTTTTLLTGPQVGYASGSVRTVVVMDAPNGISSPAVSAYVAVDYDVAGA